MAFEDTCETWCSGPLVKENVTNPFDFGSTSIKKKKVKKKRCIFQGNTCGYKSKQIYNNS